MSRLGRGAGVSRLGRGVAALASALLSMTMIAAALNLPALIA